jgi:hypothetical protein
MIYRYEINEWMNECQEILKFHTYYLMAQSVAQAIYNRMIEWLMNNELERIVMA